MQLKEGVSIAGLQPEIVLALIIAEAVFVESAQLLTVTSAVDGEHMEGSLHYVGAAVDLRYPTEGAPSVVSKLTTQLGDNYDVVPETTHIHIEFQPKRGAN